jgi:hypothetical protein
MKGDYEEEIAVKTSISVSPHVPSAPMTVSGDAVPAIAAVTAPAATRMVDVVAPIALVGGYQFHVNAGFNQSLLVEVVRVVECASLFAWFG